MKRDFAPELAALGFEDWTGPGFDGPVAGLQTPSGMALIAYRTADMGGDNEGLPHSAHPVCIEILDTDEDGLAIVPGGFAAFPEPETAARFMRACGLQPRVTVEPVPAADAIPTALE